MQNVEELGRCGSFSQKLSRRSSDTHEFADDGLHQQIQTSDEDELMTMGMLSISCFLYLIEVCN